MKINPPEIKVTPAVKVLSKRGTKLKDGSLPTMIGAIIGQINRPENIRANVHIAGPPMFILLKGGKGKPITSFEVAFPIAGNPTLDTGFKVHSFPTGKVASMTLIGPYSEFTQAIYDQLYTYVNEKGLEITGPLREIYLSNPQETPADQIVTELQIPVVGSS